MQSDPRTLRPFVLALAVAAGCLFAPSTAVADDIEFPEIDIDFRPGYAPHTGGRAGQEPVDAVASITASPLMVVGSLASRGFVLPIDIEAAIAVSDFAALSLEVVGAVFALEHVVLGGLIGSRISLSHEGLRDGWYARPAIGALVLDANVANDDDHRSPTATVLAAAVSNLGYQWTWRSGFTMQLAGILGVGVLFAPSRDPELVPLPGIDFKMGVVF